MGEMRPGGGGVLQVHREGEEGEKNAGIYIVVVHRGTPTCSRANMEVEVDSPFSTRSRCDKQLSGGAMH